LKNRDAVQKGTVINTSNNKINNNNIQQTIGNNSIKMPEGTCKVLGWKLTPINS